MRHHCFDPNWVQAYASVAISILTLLTLIVLCIYAWHTKQIANASVSQTENSQRPFLSVVQQAAVPGQVGGWFVANHGFGPAINIRGTFLAGYFPSSLPAGGVYSIHNVFPSLVQSRTAGELWYESLSGAEYTTFITWGAEGEMHLRFEKASSSGS
jgi:hypothetical protein